MGKLGGYKPKILRKCLEKKLGIAFRSGKEPFGYYILDGKKQLKVSTSNVHGSKELGPGKAKRLANQLKASSTEFGELYKCPMKGSDYEAKIRMLIKEGVL